jgi:hypothetical protein
VVRCLGGGADTRLGGVIVGGAGGGIRGIGMMKSGKRGVDGGERSRNGRFVRNNSTLCARLLLVP